MVNRMFNLIKEETCEIGYGTKARWLTNTIDVINEIKSAPIERGSAAINFINTAMYNKISLQEFLLQKIRQYLHSKQIMNFKISDFYDYLEKNDFFEEDEEEIKKSIINMILNEIIVTTVKY